MRSTRPLRLRALVAVSIVSLVWLGCTDSRDLTAPDALGPNIRLVDQAALNRAIRVLAGCGKSRVMDDSIASRKFLS